MRIGLNILYLIPEHVGGTETYARQLVRQITKYKEHDFYLYCAEEAAKTFTSDGNLHVVKLPFKSSNRVMRILYEQIVLPFHLYKDSISSLLSLGYTCPWLGPCRNVVVIHDLNWYYHPEDFSFVARLMWRLTVTLSSFFADHVITDSSASADSLSKILHLQPHKLDTILHAPPELIKLTDREAGHRIKSLGLHQPYISTVVAAYPHKNLLTLLRAFAIVARKNSKVVLVVCGLGGRAKGLIDDFIQREELYSRVKILGYVQGLDLAAIYQKSTLFVFPSSYEGFGYPPIEAMQYGVPVISSNAFSLKEVVSKGGILLDPYDVQGFANQILKVISDSSIRSLLVKRGQERLKSLTWEQTVAKTMKVLVGGKK